MKIYFSDVTKGKGVEDIRVVVYCDAALMNAERKKSQIGVVAMLMSKTEQYKIPDFEYIDPGLVRSKKQYKAHPFVGASPVAWKSMQSPRTAQSSFSAELQAMHLAVDAACLFRAMISELLYATPLRRLHTEIRNDNLSVIKSVQSLSMGCTQERRLQTLICSIQELLSTSEVTKVTFVPTDINVADEMTKAKSGNGMYHLLSNNMIQVARREAIFDRKKRAHNQKQYIIDTRHYAEGNA